MTKTLTKTARLLPALSLAALAAAGCEPSKNQSTAYNPKVLDLRSAPLASSVKFKPLPTAMPAMETSPKAAVPATPAGPQATGAVSKSGFPEMVFASPGFGALPDSAAGSSPAAMPTAAPTYAPAAMASVEVPPAPASAGPRTHVVRRGETLYSLAAGYYGSGKQWQTIADANPGVSPSRMPVGQTLMIP